MGGLLCELMGNLSAFSLRQPENLLMICPQHKPLCDLHTHTHTHIQCVTVSGEGDIKEKEGDGELWSDE